jgi:hypothetical protein
MKEIEILKSILASNFQYNFYNEAIINIRKEIIELPYYKDNWNDVMMFILFRKFPDGDSLKLIHDNANLVLFDNTEEEAYRWLDLFLVNVVNGDKDIIPYQTENKT